MDVSLKLRAVGRLKPRTPAGVRFLVQREPGVARFARLPRAKFRSRLRRV